jgi:hypothetical protein
MAVLIEAISVVIQVRAIATRYPGGCDRFVADCGGPTFCADAELVRVGFMTPQDTRQFVDSLAPFGLAYVNGGQAQDLVVVDQQRGLAAPCAWAEAVGVDWDADPLRKVMACRLIGSQLSRIMTPVGWNYEGSLSHQFKFVETGRVSEFLDFLRHENGVDVYRDLATGNEMYVRRTTPNP